MVERAGGVAERATRGGERAKRAGGEAPQQELSRTVRMSLQSLWRVLNERRSLGPGEPPPALPSGYRHEAPLAERLRQRVDWVMSGASANGRWERSARLETSLAELMAEEEHDHQRCVHALHETGLLDEGRAALHAGRLESARGDRIAQRAMVGRLASELCLELGQRSKAS